MALPLIMGLLGSTLGAGATSGVLATLGSVGAGALGSGLGRFLETGDLEEGLKTGAMSFAGGTALKGLLGGMGGQAADKAAGQAFQPTYGSALTAEGLGKAGADTFGSQLMNVAQNPISQGQAILAQSTVPPPMPKKPDPVEFENRQAGVPQNLGRRPPPGYRPGIDPEFDYGITPNFGVGLMSEDDPRYMAIGGLVGLLGDEKIQNLLGNMADTGKGFGLASLMDTPEARAEYNYMQTGEYSPEKKRMNEGGMAETDPIERGFDNNVDNVPLPDATQQNQIGMLSSLMRARRPSGLQGLGMDIRRRVGTKTDGEVKEFITDVENMAQERFDVNLGQSATPTPFSGKGGVNRTAVPTVTPRFLNPSMFGNVMRRTTGMKEGGMPDVEEGSATEIMAPDVENNKELQTIIIRAARALQGATENPEKDIQLFVEKFGMQALNDLRQRVASGELSFGKDGGIRGMIKGDGDGMSDSIEAEIVDKAGDPSGSGRPLQVAKNEYVVAADVVSDIGNGSSEAGAEKLDKLMKDVRLARHGTTEQPDEKDMMGVMKKAIA